MTAIERKFFVVTGKIDLLSEIESETKSDNFTKTDLYATTLIPIAANHYAVLANRTITDDEWIDITVDPKDNNYPTDPLVVGADWDEVKFVLVLMAAELYSKCGANGLDGFSEAGLSQSFSRNYSMGMLAMINAQKRLKTLKS